MGCKESTQLSNRTKFSVAVTYQILAWQLSSDWWLRCPGCFCFWMMLSVWQGRGIIWGRFFKWKCSTSIPWHAISRISVTSSFLGEQGMGKYCLLCPEEKWNSLVTAVCAKGIRIFADSLGSVCCSLIGFITSNIWQCQSTLHFYRFHNQFLVVFVRTSVFLL